MHFEEYITESKTSPNVVAAAGHEKTYREHETHVLHHAEQADAARATGQQAKETEHLDELRKHAALHKTAVMAHALVAKNYKSHHEDEPNRIHRDGWQKYSDHADFKTHRFVARNILAGHHLHAAESTGDLRKQAKWAKEHDK